MSPEEKGACEGMDNWLMNAEINKSQLQKGISEVCFVHKPQNSATISELTVSSYLSSHSFSMRNLQKRL